MGRVREAEFIFLWRECGGRKHNYNVGRARKCSWESAQGHEMVSFLRTPSCPWMK